MPDAATMTARSVRLSARNLDALLTSLMLPVMLMLMFVYLFGGAIHTGTAYVTYVVPGVILLCAGFGAATTAVSVSQDLAGGIVDRLRSLDVRPAGGVLLAFVVAVSALSATIGLLARSPEAANGFTFVLVFVPYASSAFVPVATMPSWIQGFARHQPVTSVVETLRALLLDRPAGSAPWIALAWCAGILLVALAACGPLFRRRVA